MKFVEILQFDIDSGLILVEKVSRFIVGGKNQSEVAQVTILLNLSNLRSTQLITY